MTMLYHIKTSPKLAENAIPPHLTTLSVSWLNKQFRAIAIHRGLIEGTWECEEEVEGTSHFERLVREAVQQTSYHGQTVTLVLAHQRMVQQLVDLPPVKGQALTRIIQRQAQAQKFFVGEPAWAHQQCPSTKGSQRVLLHLFPKILLDQLVAGCRKNNLHLTAVIPPSVVIQQQFDRFPGEKEDIDVLAAEAGGSTVVVVAKADGLLLARTLPGTWNEDPDRLALDINRTILYAGQQYGAPLKKPIWVFGRGAAEKLLALQKQLQLPAKPSPVDDSPFYWAAEAVKLRPSVCPNFVSAQLQKAPQRRIFAKVVAAGVILVLLGCLGASGFLALQARSEMAMGLKLALEEQELQTRHKELQRRNLALARKQEFVDLVMGDRSPPIPLWMLAYLGEAVPPDLVVTNFHIKQETNQWRVHVAGAVQAGRRNDPQVVAQSIATLRDRLVNGPFHLALVDPAQKGGLPAQAPPAPAARTNSPGGSFLEWLREKLPTTQLGRATNTTVAAAGPAATNFQFEGVMRDE